MTQLVYSLEAFDVQFFLSLHQAAHSQSPTPQV